MRVLTCLALAACNFTPVAAPRDDGGGGDAPVPSDAPPDAVVDAPPDAGPLLRAKTLTITNGVNGSHASFPLWVSLTDADLAAHAQPDGADIHFTEVGGAALPFERARWDAATGRLDAWVRLPSLSSGAQLQVRYGDAAAAHAPAAAATFAGYAAVWHLDDALATPTIVDATGARDGTATGLAATAQVAGKLGGAIDFTANTQQIAFANPLSGNGAHTISAWVSQRATTTNDALVVLGNGAANQARWFHARFDGPTIAVGFYGNDYANPGHDIQGDGFVLLHWVFEGTNRMTRLYRDGAQIGNAFQHAVGINTTGAAGLLGNAPAAFGANMGLAATLDEVRIIASARSATWIAAEYANQSAPATFYAVGPELALP